MTELAVSRDQPFLLPARVDDWVPATHLVRFVDALVESFTDAEWRELGIDPHPAPRGGWSYPAKVLLKIWLYGFMIGVRSTRKLEQLCRESLPMLWLASTLTPDHNTLARFYQTHRAHFHRLFQMSVRIAVEAELPDLAVVAVDGTKLRANAAGDRMLTAAHLAQLEERVAAAIAALESQAVADAPDPTLPAELTDLVALQARIARAKARIGEGRTKGNTTDPDAHQMTARGSNCPAYNAQAAVAPVRGDDRRQAGGRLIVAIDLTTAADDHGRLAAMIAAVRHETGQWPAVTVADAGYFSGAELAACAALAAPVVVPEPPDARRTGAYGTLAFTHDRGPDTLICPEGKVLTRWGTDQRGDHRYGARTRDCQACPAKAVCCPDTKRGRVIVRSPHGEVVAAHRERMQTEEARGVQRQRSGIVEGVFGTIKTGQNARQLLTRGTEAVRAEWTLLSTAFNLQTLYRASIGAYGAGVRDRLGGVLARTGPG